MKSKGFTVNEVIEPKTGRIHRIYKYDGKDCRRVLLKSRITEQLSGYCLIEKDIRNCIRWVEEINELYGDNKNVKGAIYGKGVDRKIYSVIKGLFVASLTFYGKCFSKCEGRPVKLERAQLDEKYRELHDRCIMFRHNFAAHSGVGRIEYADIALVFPVKPNKKAGVVPVELFKEIVQPDMQLPIGNSENEITLENLFAHVQEIARGKIRVLSEKIKEEEISKGYEYWSKK